LDPESVKVYVLLSNEKEDIDKNYKLLTLGSSSTLKFDFTDRFEIINYIKPSPE